MTAVVQPSGTVTLVFTDIEGSTRLLEELGTDAYREALAEHRRIVRDACARHRRATRSTTRATRSSTPSPPRRPRSRPSARRCSGLDGGPIRIRVGIHTGEPALDPPKYVGIDVHRAARIMSAAHGGQVVLSPSTVCAPRARLGRAEGPRPAPAQGSLRADPPPPARDRRAPTEFPPLKTLYRSNLPVPATPFLGRETSSPRSSQGFSTPTPACSRSPAPAAPERPGSPSRQPPKPPTAIPTASSGWRSRRFEIASRGDDLDRATP